MNTALKKIVAVEAVPFYGIVQKEKKHSIQEILNPFFNFVHIKSCIYVANDKERESFSVRAAFCFGSFFHFALFGRKKNIRDILHIYD